MTVLTNLRNALKAEHNDNLTELKNRLEIGLINEDYPECSNRDYYICRYSTSNKWSKYQNGEITREKAIELAFNREVKNNYTKWYNEKLAQVETAETYLNLYGNDIQSIDINVEWYRSSTYGNCPESSVEVHTKHLYHCYNGSRASGCGYDKETVTVASALNKSIEIKAILYQIKNDHIDQTNHGCIGYGSGYGTLPAFEGGVGMSSFRNIFENIGFKFEHVGSGKMYDCYHITKRGE